MKEWGEADVIEIGYGLSLVPRVKIKLSFKRADMSVKTVDEWQLKECVKALIHRRLYLDIAERDLVLVRDREPQKRRRDEPVAWGVLHIWDIVTAQTTEKLNGSELNVGGIKLKCEALVDDQDSVDSMQKSFGPVFSGVGENKRAQPDTLILRGIPSRWLSEPQVSFKASTLVTHTILSTFGKIRNLEVVVDGDLKKVAKGGLANIATALHCDIYVQYETSSGFDSALRAFCGRSMKKDMSSCNVDYVVCWDKDSYFSEKNIRKRRFEKGQQALIERNQLAHQAELARIEKGKQEAEIAKQLLWEEDQRKRKKEEAMRAEETRIRMEQERELKKKEEELHEKKEEELRAAELQMRMEQEKLLQQQKEEEKLLADELRMRLEQERILQQQKAEDLVKEQHVRREDNRVQHVAQEKQREKQILEQSLRRRLQAQQDIIRLEGLHKKLEDEWGRRREDKGNIPEKKIEEFSMRRQENLMDDRWPLNVRNVTQGQYDQENPMDDRWQLEATETPASSWAAEVLSQTTGRLSENRVCHSLSNEEDSSMQHSVKRLRSIIIGTSMK